MALDDLADAVANALRDLDRRQRTSEDAVARAAARFDALVDVLTAKDVLTAGHAKHLERCAKNAAPRPTVRLQTYVDKYAMPPGEPIDCAARMALCKGRCCKLTVVLTEQDLDEGKLQWELHEPYVLRRTKANRCVYQDGNSGLCTNYEHRPATCRSYSCKEDPRIWLDFENRIPAPVISLDPDDDDLMPAR